MSRVLYRLLLRLLPRSFRRRHGADMEAVFLEALERGRRIGRRRVAALLLREGHDLVRTSLALRLERRRSRQRDTGNTSVGGGAMGYGSGFFTRVRDDVRHAVRSLVRRPGFTLLAAGTMALGVGATTAVFSALESVLLNPLPYEGAERMVGLYRTVGGDDSFLVTPEEEQFHAWRERRNLFEEVVRIRTTTRGLTGVGEARQVHVAMIEPDFLDFLGVAPVLGRSFSPEEGAGAGGHVALLAHALWQDAFGGRRSVLGSTLTLDGEPHTVIGVLPPRVPIPPHPTVRMDVFVPFGLSTVRQAQVVARLADGVTPGVVNATLEELAAAAETAGEPASTWQGSAQSTRAMMGQPVADTLRVLMLAVVLLLLIACANVCNLLLSRQARRVRETAVRSALGAGRARLVSEQFLESLGLGLLGGLAGLGLAWLAIRGMASLRGDALDVLGLVRLDVAVLAFALVVTVGSAVLTGMLPALYAGWSRTAPALAGARGTGGTARRDGRTRWALLTVEIALSFALLVGASLVLRSLWEMRGRDPGFAAEGLATLRLDLPGWKYGEDGWVEVDRRIEAALGRLPGVEAVGRASGVPPGGGVFFGDVEVEGRGPVEGARLFYGHAVESGYFDLLGQRVIEGRDFTPDEVRAGDPVAVLGEGAAQRLFPDGDAVGGRLRQQGEWRTVVGVVADVAQRGLGFPRPELQMYQPLDFGGGYLILRSTGDLDDVMAAVGREVRAAEPDAVVLQLAAVDRMLQATLGRERFTTALLGAFAFLALLLSAVGLYGVVSQVVGRRTREIGIRMSMGARTSAIVAMVLRQGLGATVAGLLLGTGLAAAGLTLLESQVFGVGSPGPGTFAVSGIVVVTTALFACWIPARKAAATDPSEALRSE